MYNNNNTNLVTLCFLSKEKLDKKQDVPVTMVKSKPMPNCFEQDGLTDCAHMSSWRREQGGG